MQTMKTSAIATIMRREVRDTLSDWRIVLPIALLTFILPQLLVGASRVVVNYVDDAELAGRLTPFAALLVGFVPASFSLITALESFVGERERNSLEALLSMPIDDRDLYISKLYSSLVIPLISSFSAMLVFTFMLYVFTPDLYFAAITLPRLLLLFALVGLMALTMVAGAVVISSHISSIRAANLMSSMVLLPMAGVVQLEAVLIINQRWESLWLVGAGLAVLSGLLVRAGLATFNREEILSREHQRGAPGARPSAVSPSSRRSPPIVVIARRELVETLTDWRVLIPVFILTCVLPAALVGGVNFAIGFLGGASQIGLLVPFAALLVGFVPASFSLITALESFVGERERNSLEALLSMPITDRQLYISKLFSALVIPLVSSIIAMLAFLFGIATFFPDLYAIAMTPLHLVQILVMIMMITLVMVSGAVVISSHTGSVRAATLLASFVLIPSAIILQLQALLFIARRWDVLWFLVAALAVIALALIRAGLAAFNREEILSREHEQLSFRRITDTFRLFFYEYQPAGVTPDFYQGLPLSALRFYRQELPRLLYELRLPIAVALLAAISGMLSGGYVGSNYDVGAFDAYLAQVGAAPPPSPLLALAIFANNLRVSILSNVFSAISFGIFAFLVPAVAFAQIGFVSSALADQGGSWLTLGADSPLQFILAYVFPHGIIELPAFILSAAIGLRIGAALLAPPKGFSAGQNVLWALANFTKIWLFVLLPMILAGSLVEGLLTPLVIAALYS